MTVYPLTAGCNAAHGVISSLIPFVIYTDWLATIYNQVAQSCLPGLARKFVIEGTTVYRIVVIAQVHALCLRNVWPYKETRYALYV